MKPAVAPVSMREAGAGDAQSVAALATLVFLDTYAPDGLRPDLAREVSSGYSEAAFIARLADAKTAFLLAESAQHLVGFIELAHGTPAISAVAEFPEVVRLYIHPRFQRRGIGKALLARAEQHARDRGSHGFWLSAWSGNARALAFYAVLGYKFVGKMDHMIEGTAYENHILARQFQPAAS